MRITKTKKQVWQWRWRKRSVERWELYSQLLSELEAEFEFNNTCYEKHAGPFDIED